jgi:hypothetical protein
MKVKWIACTLIMAAALLPVAVNSQEGVSRSGTFPYPPPFDKFGVEILSEPYRMALANHGRMLYSSRHLAAKGLVKFAGGNPNLVVEPGSPSGLPPAAPQPFAPTVSVPCGTADGAKFNLEPTTGDPLVNLNAGGLGAAVVQPLQQDEQSADFLFAGGGSGGDFLVGGSNDLRGFFGGMGGSATLTAFHTKNTKVGTFDCKVQVESGTPFVVDINGKTLAGSGDPVIAADNTHSMVFAIDLHFGTGASGFAETSIGVFRTTPAAVGAAACASAAEGPAKNAACWPHGIVLNAADSGAAAGIFNDKPHATVDERTSGTGAGDVYVTWTEFTAAATNIALVACKNSFLTLADCSSVVVVASVPAASPSFLQFSHVALRPANASSPANPGEITITYVKPTPMGFSPLVVPATETMDIDYVKCTPMGAPVAPICGAVKLVATETTPIFFPHGTVSGQLFRVATEPKHDHRVNSSGGTDTWVVWDHCTINSVSLTAYSLGGFGGAPAIPEFICPNADILISKSTDDGVTFGAPTILAGGIGDQFMPWARADRGAGGNSLGTINISYYDTVPDLARHDLKVKLIQIPPTSSTPGAPITVTSLNNDPSGDFELRDLFYGDYIGVAARGPGTTVGSCASTCRAYPTFTRSNDPGVLGGAGHGGTGAATVTLTETNNHVSLVTY